MESVGSNFPAADTIPVAAAAPSQHVADRIIRALSHQLRLLHRSNTDFFILGATGNVYTVALSASPSCTCPDRTVPCKHILFVYLRVLSLPFGDPCLWRRTLRSCHLTRLLCAPMATDALASARARERFHQLFSGSATGATAAGASGCRRVEGGALCPVCLEEMDCEGADGGIVTCGACGNSLHGECLEKWKRSRGRRAASCVVCRARWRERRELERYVNLAAYVGEDCAEEEGNNGGLCAN